MRRYLFHDGPMRERPMNCGRGGRRSVSFRTTPLEVQLHSEFHESRLQNPRRPLPRSPGELVVLREHRRRVDQIVDIDHALHPASVAEPDALRDPEVYLIHAVPVERSWRNDVDTDVRVTGAGRRSTPPGCDRETARWRNWNRVVAVICGPGSP